MLLSSLVYTSANAQVKACIFCATNITDQPSWGPAGYQFVYFYYIPEIEVYYYVPQHQFTYKKDGYWVTSTTLPLKYAAFNFYRAYKVVMNADGTEPYLEHNQNKVQYAAYKSKHDQPVNRDNEEYKQARQKGDKQNLTAQGN